MVQSTFLFWSHILRYDFGKNRSLAPAPSAYILKSDIEI